MKVKINPPHITRAPPWCKLDPARNNTRTHRAVKSDSGRHNEIHIGTAVHDNGTHTHKPSAYNLYRVGMKKKKAIKKLRYVALRSIKLSPSARRRPPISPSTPLVFEVTFSRFLYRKIPLWTVLLLPLREQSMRRHPISPSSPSKRLWHATMPSGRHALTPKMGVKEELQNFCLPTGAGNVMSAVGTRNNKSLKVLALGKEKKK